jgi:hypothetical protein
MNVGVRTLLLGITSPFVLLRASITSASVIAILAFPGLAAPLFGGPISNPTFETGSNWTLSENDPNGYLSGGYTSEWSSDGGQSFKFVRAAAGTIAGTWVQIAQSGVNLTGVTEFIFDCQDTGIDTDPTLYLQFLVDGSEVGRWSNNGHPGGQGGTWGSTATTADIEIPLSAKFTGAHELAIRLYQNIGHSPADPKVYRIDNLRVIGGVPEPSSLAIALLALGGLALVRRYVPLVTR